MYLKVLIIEDSEDDTILLCRYLKTCGFEPKWQRVETETELAEAVEDRRWDLVLCDFAMPQLTPFIAVDCVRRINPQIPILIVTGAVSERSAVELLQHGVQDVVLKDDLPRLKSAITRELAFGRQRREKAAAERRFAAALQSLHQGVALYDADARLITCNRQYSAGLDRCESEIHPGIHYGELVDLAFDRGQYAITREDNDPAVMRLLAYDAPTGTSPIEVRHHDGRWMEVERHRTEDDGIVTITTDITEIKQREDELLKQAAELSKINKELVQEIQQREATQHALRESENRAQAIFQSAVDGMITFDEDNLIESVNPAAEEIFGYSAEELTQLHVHHLMFLGEPSAPAATDNAVAPPPRPERADFSDRGVRLVTGWRKNGEAFPIELTVSPVELRNRRIYTGVIRDVTERTKLDRMKSEFVSVVSHELRTPLTSIRGSLALLNTGAVGELPPRAKSMIAIGLQNSERLLRLIDDILDVEKIESGKMAFTFEPTNIRTLLDNALKANQALLDEHDLHGEIVFRGAEDAVVEGDHDRLMQVLSNLISNAAKYSPEKGTVTIGADVGAQEARIWVRDDGAGIPEAFQERIFQKFSQADASDTRQKNGTGLGLSIAKAIIDQHGGTIDYNTEKNAGTTFYFDIPLTSAEASPVATSQTA